MAVTEPRFICTDCLTTFAHPKGGDRPGSFLIEVILWLVTCVGGLIYTIWRFSACRPVCPKCGGQNFIPTQTPRGQELLAQCPAVKTAQLDAEVVPPSAPPAPPAKSFRLRPLGVPELQRVVLGADDAFHCPYCNAEFAEYPEGGGVCGSCRKEVAP